MNLLLHYLFSTRKALARLSQHNQLLNMINRTTACSSISTSGDQQQPNTFLVHVVLPQRAEVSNDLAHPWEKVQGGKQRYTVLLYCSTTVVCRTFLLGFLTPTHDVLFRERSRITHIAVGGIFATLLQRSQQLLSCQA